MSILDPKQVAYLLELTDDLKDYGFSPDILDRAFFRFKIDKKIGDNLVRLVRTEQSLIDCEEPLFALPDVIDEEKGPYVDFVEHITKLRAKLLNDSIEFTQNITAEEISDELAEKYRLEYFEGTSLHVYRELTDILEYVPEGFDLDREDKPAKNDDDEYADIQTDDLDTKEEIEADETMQWEEGE